VGAVMGETPDPAVVPAQSVTGKTLLFRNAEVMDAEFILSLRTDPEKSRYLSKVSDDLVAQQEWLEGYARSKGQAYFIIEFENRRIGTVRLYDGQGSSFCWGSWILTTDRPRHAAVESALMVYSYGVDHLGFSRSHFDVRKENARVCSFHERMGALRVSETEADIFYQISKNAITKAREELIEFLPNRVVIVNGQEA
jgi:RimJ/RimL family protein N-acetyltransferase